MCVLRMFVCFLFGVALLAGETETVGRRPYEMVDAGRTEDSRPPLLDFENLDGWTAETTAAEARLERSREQRLWGDYVAKLTYKSVANEAPSIVLKPPRPIPVGKEFDCVNFWVYGNNWSWAPDPTTPRVSVSLVLQGDPGRAVTVAFTPSVCWKEWFLYHKKLSPKDLESLGDHPRLDRLRNRRTARRFRTVI